jgi:alpha-tubulin suppressor-like RCC1 family protein
MLKRVFTGLCFSLLAATSAHAQVATVVPSFSTFSGITADASLRLYYAGLTCNGVAGDGTSGCTRKVPSFTSWAGPCTSAAIGSNSAFCISGTALQVTGQNAYGELGVGTTTPRLYWTAVTLPGTLSVPKKVVAGLRNSYVLKSDGSLYVAGYTGEGLRGITSTASGTTYTLSLSGVADVFAGENNVYAVKTDGTLWSAGVNAKGTLGAGTTAAWSNWTQTMPSGVKKVVASATHALLLKSDGSVWAAGGNEAGQFGQGFLSTAATTTWTRIAGNARDIAVGLNGSYVLGNNNQLYVAGDNSYGALGAGPVSSAPSFVSVLNNVANLNTSRYGALAVRGDGTLWGAGQNANGELGLGHTTMSMSWQQALPTFGVLAPLLQLPSVEGISIIPGNLSPAKVLLSVPAGGATWRSSVW